MNRFRGLVSLAIAFTAISWNAHAYQTRQEISGGDFESGRNSWVLSNEVGFASTSSGIMSNSAKAYGGSWYGYVGDYTTNTFHACGGMFQNMSFTNTTTNLDISFYLNISSADSSGVDHDDMYVFLEHLDQNGTITNIDTIASFSNLDKDSGTGSAYYNYKRYRFPISSPGKTQRLLFWTVTDSSRYTVFRIDNVSVISYFPDPIINYTVHSFVESGSGTISPIGDTTVAGGGSVSFTASPSSDWTVDKWKMNGSTIQTGGNSFSLDNVVANTDISVSFARTLHQLNVNVVSGSGSYTLNPSGGWYTNGTPVTLTAIPSSGYQFSEWKNDTMYSRESQITYNMSAVGSLGMSGPKTLGDPLINLYFAQNYQPPNVGIRSSGSIPTFTVNPVQDWLTVVETTWDLINGIWTPVSVQQGTQPTDYTFPQGQSNGFIRSSVWPLVTAPGFMKFPIHESESPHTWLSANVTAIMDHSPMARLAGRKEKTNDFQITTYLGDSFRANIEDTDGTHMAYISTNELTRPLEFNYQKILDSNNKFYLNYDNHQGYDYGGFSTNTDVYPACNGNTVTENDDFVRISNLSGIINYYMTNYHAVIIHHKNNDGTDMGFCTAYLHLSDISTNLVDKAPASGWAPRNSVVNVNTPIGKVGSYDKIAGITDNKSNIHLHFEVWMLHSDGIWRLYDPYGAQTINTNIIYNPLWTN